MKRTGKRLLALLLLLTMCLSLFPTLAFAEEGEYPDPSEESEPIPSSSPLPSDSPDPESAPQPREEDYPLGTPAPTAIVIYQSGTCGENLTWTLDFAGTLNIYGSGEMDDYNSGDLVDSSDANPAPWYEWRNQINSVQIQPGVTSIGNCAFDNCFALVNVLLPDGLTCIGEYAFEECYCLSGITIPSSVSSIGRAAFEHCEKLAGSIVIPEGITRINRGTFFDCYELSSISIPVSVTNIDFLAFYCCNNLTDVYYAGTRSQWEGIVIGNENQSLLNATIHFKEPATSGTCGQNLAWKLDANGTLTISGKGPMANYSTMCDAPWYDSASSIKKVVIQSGVSSIGDYAFFWCANIKSVTIPSSVTSIGDGAFCWCQSLGEISVPNSVASIGGSAFLGSGLTSIKLPKSLSGISDHMFLSCQQLTSITIPEGVTSIGDEAFRECSGLTSISLPSSLTSIGELAFDGCSLKSITIPRNVSSIASNAFLWCSSLESIKVDSRNPYYCDRDGVLYSRNTSTLVRFPCAKKVGAIYILPYAVTTIGDWAFQACSGINYLILPTGVKMIGPAAFRYSSVVGVYCPYYLTSIGNGAFLDCEKLYLISIPSTVNQIGDYAFYDCSSLKVINYGGSRTAWDNLISGTQNQFPASIEFYEYAEINPNNIINRSGFDMSSDSFSFNNPSLPYRLTKEDYQHLMNLLNPYERLYVGKYYFAHKNETGGLCYGVSALMALMKQGLPPSTYYGSTTVRGLPGPSSCPELYSAITYYHTLQYLPHLDFLSFPNCSDSKQAEVCSEIIHSLLNDDTPVIVNISFVVDGALLNKRTAHAVLAYAVDPLTDPENILIFFADPNALSLGIPLILKVDKSTFLPADSEINLGGINQYVKELKIFRVDHTSDYYHYLLRNTEQFALLFTTCTDSSKLKVTGSAGEITLGEPIYPAGSTEDSPAAYLLPYADWYTLQYSGGEPILSMMYFSGGQNACAVVDSNAQELRFEANGAVFMSEASGESSVSTVVSANPADLYTATVTGCNTDLAIENVDGRYRVSSQERLDDTTITVGNDIFEKEYGESEGETECYLDELVTVKAGQCGEMAYWMLDDDGTLKISGFDGLWDFSAESPAPWAEDRDKILAVEIDEGITGIENLSFEGCGNLRSIRFLGNAPSFESDCFRGITATVLYPSAREGWSTAIQHSYGGAITWVPYDADGGVLVTPEITLEQEYLLLTPGDEVQILASANLRLWEDNIRWSVENTDANDAAEIIQVDAFGKVTAITPGSAYAIASLTVDGATYTARCRVDVVAAEDAPGEGTEPSPASKILYASLPEKKVKLELFSTDYASFDVLLELEQLRNPTAAGLRPEAELPQPQDHGHAISAARFQDEAVALLFDLRVADDRTLTVVPRYETLEQALVSAKAVKGSYSSAVIVTVDGQDFVTQDAAGKPVKLTLTVGKTQPKLKAAELKFNSFLANQELPLRFTGGQVTAIARDDAAAAKNAKKDAESWLEVDYEAQTARLRDGVEGKQSGSLYLTVTLDGWAITQQVAVKVSAARTVPKLKLKSTSVTLLPGTEDRAVLGYTLSPAAFGGRQPQVTRIVETGKNGASYENGDFILCTVGSGQLALQAPHVRDDALAHTYKVYLGLDGYEFPSPVTVKTLKPGTFPTLSVKAGGSIDTGIPKSPITLKLSLKNYHLGSGEQYSVMVRQQKPAKGTSVAIDRSVNHLLDIEIADGVITLTEKVPGSLESGYTYAAYVSAEIGGAATNEVRTKLSVKWSNPDKVKVSGKLKAAGKLDPLRPQSSLLLTPQFKNCFGCEPKAADLAFYRSYKDPVTKKTVTVPADDFFRVEEEDGSFRVWLTAAAAYSKADKVKAELRFEANGASCTTPQISLSVKPGSAKLSAAPTGITLLAGDRYSSGSFRITAADPSLADVAAVTMDAKSAALFDLVDLGQGSYVLAYKGHLVPAAAKAGKSFSVKLSVTFDGAPADAVSTVTLKVNIR